MITQDDRLIVLDNFSIDETLPKFKKDVEQLNVNPRGNVLIRTTGGSIFQATSNGTFDIGNIAMEGSNPERPSGLQRMIDKAKALFKKKETIEISVEQFFSSLKETASDIKLIEERIKGYDELLERTKSSGQIALQERVLEQMHMVKEESKLLDAGFTKYITERDVVTFYKKSDRGLALDYVKNFTRVIPCEIIDAKNELDKLHVFDNYVIMHYDPNKEAYALTKEEIEKKKDPILFGIIQGSDRLYFVGDWVDEVCDLTFDGLIEVLGEDKLDENELKVNIYGDVNLIDCKED